jgi:AcrR family transcriptional regulator
VSTRGRHEPAARERGSNGHLGRDKLVVAAADLADREGWLNLSLSRVAKEVDRHVTSLYSYVDGLEGLRREITLLALEELGQQLWQAALGRSGSDALLAVATVYRDYACAHPGRIEALTTFQDSSDDEVRARGRYLAEPVNAILRSIGLDESQVVHAHRVFFSALRGFTITEATTGFRLPISVDETFDQLLALFVDALTGGTWPQLTATAASA